MNHDSSLQGQMGLRRYALPRVAGGIWVVIETIGRRPHAPIFSTNLFEVTQEWGKKLLCV